MIGDSVGIDIPALMVGAADGNLFLDEINNDQTIDVVLNKSFFLTETDTGNNMGSFFITGPGAGRGYSQTGYHGTRHQYSCRQYTGRRQLCFG